MLKVGDVVLLRDGLPLPASAPEAAGFIKQAGGFTYFGDGSLDATLRSPYTVCVASEIAHVLALHRKQLDSFIGISGGLASRGEVVRGTPVFCVCLLGGGGGRRAKLCGTTWEG